jgi:hypothetical protein
MNTSGSQIHYQVNNKQFFNVYLAYYESQQSGCPVEFYCRESEYDRYNWTQEPEQDFETLMDAIIDIHRVVYQFLNFLFQRY